MLVGMVPLHGRHEDPPRLRRPGKTLMNLDDPLAEQITLKFITYLSRMAIP